MKTKRWLHFFLLAALAPAHGCGAATTERPVDAPPESDPGAQHVATPAERAAAAATAGTLLDRARQQALARKAAVIVVLHADWCQPCNELAFRFLETREGKALTDKQVTLAFDFDEPIGSAVASELRVLGLPTTLILRPQADRLVEYARIEGFDQPDEYQMALNQALIRTQPSPSGCENADDRPLDATRPAALVVADAECLGMQLATVHGARAAERLQAFFTDPGQLRLAEPWPLELRIRLGAVGQALGRWQSRVAQDQLAGARLFGALAAWPGAPPNSLPALVFWHARCLAKAGDSRGAEAVLDAWLAQRQQATAARLLAAEVLVLEHIRPERAQQLITEVLRADPNDHWAQYLAGDLAMARGDRDAARRHLQAANRLKPGVALYMRHYMRLSGDSIRSE